MSLIPKPKIMTYMGVKIYHYHVRGTRDHYYEVHFKGKWVHFKTYADIKEFIKKNF